MTPATPTIDLISPGTPRRFAVPLRHFPGEEPRSVYVPAEAERLRGRVAKGLAGAAAVLLVVLALLGLSAGAGVAESAAAPEFDLPLLDGGRVTNAALNGRRNRDQLVGPVVPALS